MPHIDVGDQRIEYSVVRGQSRRFTYFRFGPDMTLEVSVPRGRKVDVDRLLTERRAWISREFRKASATRRILGPDHVMFGGNYLRIVHVEDGREGLAPDEARGEVVIRTSDRRGVRELVRRWFLKETSSYVVRKVRESAPLMGVRPSRVDVREIGKWGYCTRGGRLSFSWQLIALPERLREYVVLHELAHLLEFNHSASFRRRLAAVCPDYRARERELDLIVPYDRLSLG